MGERAALIALDNVGYRRGGRQVLSGLTWRMEPGQAWGVVGANGAGKSTFLRLLRGEIWPAPDQGRRLYGLDGPPEESPLAMRAASRLVSAELMETYRRRDWNLSLLDTVCAGFGDTAYLHHEISPAQRARARELIAELGLAHLVDQPLLRLSRGQMKRALIARALVGDPAILFLDEGCEDLDRQARPRVLGLLTRRVEAGMGLVVASHREDELLPCLTHLLRLAGGRIAWQGLRQAAPPLSPAGEREDWFPAASDPTTPPTRTPDQPEPPPLPYLVRLRGVEAFLDHKLVLERLDWEIAPGQGWAVLGPNGAGKTTLLRLLIGDLLPALGGQVRWFGQARRHSIWELRQRISLVSADLQSWHSHPQTGLETVISGFTGSVGLNAPPTPEQTATARAWLERLELTHLAERDVTELSYGELRRLLIARAMVTRPDLLLLDEPFAGLDPASREQVRALLDHLAQAGVALVVVTHHDQDLPQAVTNLLALDQGRVVFRGPRADHRSRPDAPGAANG
ncbi:MAG: ATP-binding cassette domain-containing protein [Desulfarculus sp.]|nr:ATP-binding cassette domain-containing protein [Desulfarculus sp.]